MEQQELIPHLFRTEYRKIVSVLCKRFGFEQIEVAEDIASDTFLTAAQTWGWNGAPKNPTAWLYNVAKNKAKNYLHRDTIFKSKIAPQIITRDEISDSLEIEIDLSPQNIDDSQLQMMFAVCHPSISPEAQIGFVVLALKKLQMLFLPPKKPSINGYLEQKKNSANKKLKLNFQEHLKLISG